MSLEIANILFHMSFWECRSWGDPCGPWEALEEPRRVLEVFGGSGGFWGHSCLSLNDEETLMFMLF